jgi:hypothetical protein
MPLTAFKYAHIIVYIIDTRNIDMTNIIQITKNNTKKTIENFFNFSCRMKELEEAVLLFDKNAYPEEFIILLDEYCRVNEQWEILKKGLLSDLSGAELRMVYQTAEIMEWGSQWWIKFLRKNMQNVTVNG